LLFDLVTENVACLWFPNRGLRPLPHLPGMAYSSAYQVSNNGEVIGVSQNSYADFRAVRWDRHGNVHALPLLPGDNSSEPGQINARGQITGLSAETAPDAATYSAGTLHIRPVVWENGQVRVLPTGPTGEGISNGINDHGQIVGRLLTGPPGDSFQSRAVMWDRNGITDLGSLGGAWTAPYVINNRGQVVGFGAIPGGVSNGFIGELHAFFWENGVMTDLGTLGGTYSGAWGLNNRGQIVGEATYPGDTINRATIWENGAWRDLNNLIPADSGWTLIFTAGINDRGQIVGGGLHNNERRTFVLTPTR